MRRQNPKYQPIKPSTARREKTWLRSMVVLRPRSVDKVAEEEGSGVACRAEANARPSGFSSVFL